MGGEHRSTKKPHLTNWRCRLRKSWLNHAADVTISHYAELVVLMGLSDSRPKRERGEVKRWSVRARLPKRGRGLPCLASSIA